MAMDEPIPCTVKEFQPERGFGTLVLEDGRELPFDISVCQVRGLSSGVRCLATLAARPTGLKVVRLQSEPPPGITLEDGVAQLHAWGLLTEWDARACRERLPALPLRAATELTGGRPRPPGPPPRELSPDDAAVLLFDYYGEGLSARARADRTFFMPSADTHSRYAKALAEGLLVLIGEPGFFTLKLKSAHTGVITDRSGQKHDVRVGHGDSVVPVVNRLLEAAAVPGRIHQKKLFGTPWLTFREQTRRPTGVLAALFL
ncbi:MAG TPA: hypothetical protein VF815_20810 [Myxococcaceae bacterium]|jgi:hypothetical protein